MLTFTLPDGSSTALEPRIVCNAGYAGRDQDAVASHIAELAELGVPAPSVTPSLYPISPYLAQQTDEIAVQHGRTSGEAEWALVITGESRDDVLLTVACDHTDRELEVHGVAWSKNASPDVLGTQAWRLSDVADHVDDITLAAWVGEGNGPADTLIQSGTLGDLLAPDYWLDVLEQRGLLHNGTVLISGTIPMIEGVDQFADSWRVVMTDGVSGHSIECGYRVEQMPAPIG